MIGDPDQNPTSRLGASCAPTLRQIAQHVPLGHQCRSCGHSTYNVLCRLGDYLETGEPCCASLAEWIGLAKAGAPTVNELHSAKLAARRGVVS